MSSVRAFKYFHNKELLVQVHNDLAVELIDLSGAVRAEFQLYYPPLAMPENADMSSDDTAEVKDEYSSTTSMLATMSGHTHASNSVSPSTRPVSQGSRSKLLGSQSVLPMTTPFYTFCHVEVAEIDDTYFAIAHSVTENIGAPIIRVEHKRILSIWTYQGVCVAYHAFEEAGFISGLQRIPGTQQLLFKLHDVLYTAEWGKAISQGLDDKCICVNTKDGVLTINKKMKWGYLVKANMLVLLKDEFLVWGGDSSTLLQLFWGRLKSIDLSMLGDVGMVRKAVLNSEGNQLILFTSKETRITGYKRGHTSHQYWLILFDLVQQSVTNTVELENELGESLLNANGQLAVYYSESQLNAVIFHKFQQKKFNALAATVIDLSHNKDEAAEAKSSPVLSRVLMDPSLQNNYFGFCLPDGRLTVCDGRTGEIYLDGEPLLVSATSEVANKVANILVKTNEGGYLPNVLVDVVLDYLNMGGFFAPTMSRRNVPLTRQLPIVEAPEEPNSRCGPCLIQ